MGRSPDAERPDAEARTPGMPSWVKAGIVVVLALVLAIVVLWLAGLHEPRLGHGA